MSYTIPDVRSDCSYRLALLFADICYLDSLYGCTARNEWFVARLKKVAGEALHPSTIKDLIALLKSAGLVEAEIEHGNDRVLRPLVALAKLFPHWRELAQICVRRMKLPPSIRAAARAALAPSLTNRRAPSVERLAGSAIGSLRADKSAPPPPPTPRRFPLFGKEPIGERQQTECVVREPELKAVADPAAVSLLRESGLPEPDAVSIAVEATISGWSLERVRQAVRAARAKGESVRNPGGFVRAALRGGWLPPAPASEYASDRGERPQRVVKTTRPIPPDWLPGVDYETARGLCNEAVSALRAMGDPSPPSAEIRDMARLLWQRANPGAIPAWRVALAQAA